MRIPYYHVDAFTSARFEGNPAGVCLLEGWLPDDLLQKIAAEHNLSETAFLVAKGGEFELRWFTPVLEVDLCGHATLATAHVMFAHRNFTERAIIFESRSGPLTVSREKELLVLDFPSRPPVPSEVPGALVRGLKLEPAEVLRARDCLAVFSSSEEVRRLRPDFTALLELDCLGVIATAPGENVDFVSRFFAPRAGIPEDPVTGSAHCILVPYWGKRLGKKKLTARQVSPRGGELFCEEAGERVKIGGRAVTYMTGEIDI
jgi:PhzF family phenazine biosynthesis protein